MSACRRQDGKCGEEVSPAANILYASGAGGLWEWGMGSGRGRLFCYICGVARSRELGARSFKRCAARHYVVIGAFGAWRCARLGECSLSVIPGYDPGSLSECEEMGNGELGMGHGKWEMGNGKWVRARLFCYICAVARSRELGARRFKRCAARGIML